ncbi:hypothetical protein FHS89_002295 [Rubricella aquisinus]|uniref:Type II secretion system protein GspE N-terminal domain-containing protein n=1 Tax=Rubricella aquisinus TaxID=2028108 RepID=A0A840WMI3_9RHOB|nr:glycosyltransferase [Rubricella aquisinus]MBB5516269.1 hypothetical protein [Rubricella aquisinus]
MAYTSETEQWAAIVPAPRVVPAGRVGASSPGFDAVTPFPAPVQPLRPRQYAIDLAQNPAQDDRARLLSGAFCAEHLCLPWRSFGLVLVVAVTTITDTDRVRAELARHWRGSILFSFADERSLHAEITRCHGAELAEAASTLCPTEYACRDWAGALRPSMLAALAAGLLLFAIAAPSVALTLLLGWIVIMNTATTVMRMIGLMTKPSELAPEPPPLPEVLPVVSILLPVHKEPEIVDQLVQAISKIEYPAHLLDIKLLIEAHDDVTRAALSRSPLPDNIEVLDIPPGGPTTKPRAMNYALPFCRGSIVGIYDAEDRPDPDQVTLVVRSLAAAPARGRVCAGPA